jgi:hypothetical protein
MRGGGAAAIVLNGVGCSYLGDPVALGDYWPGYSVRHEHRELLTTGRYSRFIIKVEYVS